MMNYIGILDRTDGTWGVRIPDLPGCYGAGSSHEEAMADATDAVREWIAHQRARGVAIPAARTVDAVLADLASDLNAATEAAVVIAPDGAAPPSATAGMPVGAI